MSTNYVCKAINFDDPRYNTDDVNTLHFINGRSGDKHQCFKHIKSILLTLPEINPEWKRVVKHSPGYISLC